MTISTLVSLLDREVGGLLAFENTRQRNVPFRPVRLRSKLGSVAHQAAGLRRTRAMLELSEGTAVANSLTLRELCGPAAEQESILS